MSNSSSDYDNLSPEEKEIYGTPPEKTLAQELSEKKFKEWVKHPQINMDPKTWQMMHRKSPTFGKEIKKGFVSVPKKHWRESLFEAVNRGKKARLEQQEKLDKESQKEVENIPNIFGGRKTRKKCKIFRNNSKKNKILRKYIMLKQCGGGKAKMGSKSKPYSSKAKAMRSRRRVCYYKKKGRTLKLKKHKKKHSRKKSRRRRRR